MEHHNRISGGFDKSDRRNCKRDPDDRRMTPAKTSHSEFLFLDQFFLLLFSEKFFFCL